MWRSFWDMGTFVLTTTIFINGGNKCRRSQVFVYLKSESPETYTGIPQLLPCMPYLLRYGDIKFGSHFEKWPSPRYAQFMKCPRSSILKPYAYITQINSQTFLSTKCLRAYRAGPGLVGVSHFPTSLGVSAGRWFACVCWLFPWSGGRMVERRSANRGVGGSMPPTAVSKLRQFRPPHICLCLSEETLKPGGPFYLVSSGELLACSGLARSRVSHV